MLKELCQKWEQNHTLKSCTDGAQGWGENCQNEQEVQPPPSKSVDWAFSFRLRLRRHNAEWRPVVLYLCGHQSHPEDRLNHRSLPPTTVLVSQPEEGFENLYSQHTFIYWCYGSHLDPGPGSRKTCIWAQEATGGYYLSTRELDANHVRWQCKMGTKNRTQGPDWIWTNIDRQLGIVGVWQRKIEKNFNYKDSWLRPFY